jgi:hypothetical protein
MGRRRVLALPLDLGVTGPLSGLDQGLLAPIRTSPESGLVRSLAAAPDIGLVRSLAAAPDIGPVGIPGRGWLSLISVALPELSNLNDEEGEK